MWPHFLTVSRLVLHPRPRTAQIANIHLSHEKVICPLYAAHELRAQLSGSPNSSWLATGRSAFGASLWASRNLHSGIKAEIGLFAESRLAPRTID
jgi:hypothetical protein